MREFSRVEAYVPLSVRLLKKDEVEMVKSRLSGDITFLSSKPIDEPSDKALAEWLKFINQKIDFLISIITIEQQGFSSLPINKVDISGGGMSFRSKIPYERGNVLEIKMVIENPTPLALYLYGEVISCEAIDHEFRIGLKFVNIDEDVRDQIVKFVFHRQRQIIRQRREI